MKNLNLPNKLTMLRVFMIPFFLLFELAFPAELWAKWAAFLVFGAASLTDKLDGTIARRRNLVTNFGKFMDPLADKLLVCSAMIVFAGDGRMPVLVVIVIVAREFIISGFRLIAAEQGKVIAAGPWGKAKTVFQMVMVCFKILDINAAFIVIGDVLMWIALALTVISLVDYLWKNKEVLKDE
jgi:CDP-diacylglycerol--glycerol-3-phosphate 3-phosphatidyltransferase